MQSKPLVISICVSAVLAVLPFILIFFSAGGNYPKLPVEVVSDSMYYYSRAADIAKGNIFIGNPYIKENKTEVSPAFFVADWLWAVPLFLGFGIQTSIIINQIFWFLIFGIFLYYLFKFFDVKEKYIHWAVSFVILSVYWYLSRPVAMQVIYPVFLLWLVSFGAYLKNPKSRKNIILLGIATALSGYIYTYLAQIIFVAFCIALIASFFPRFKEYRFLWFSATIAGLLSIPFLLYTWKQVHHPFYFETMARIGLVHTNMIGTPAVLYSFLILLSLLLVYLHRDKFSNAELYLVVSFSLGLIIATLSNVFTGVDLETALHIGRFTEVWIAVMFIVFFQKVRGGLFWLYAVLAVSFFLLQIQPWGNIPAVARSHMLSKEPYIETLNWLKNNTPEESVILADDSLSGFIPLFTSDYVLFHPHASLQIDSDMAVQDRYLSSRILGDLSVQDIKNDMPKYAGNGLSTHRYMVYNRNVKVCKLLRFNLFGKNCGEIQTSASFAGEKYFTDMKDRYDVFKKTPLSILQKYNVSYIILDKQNDRWKLPILLKLEWSNDRFAIYKL